jgi:hypothetical protein
MNMDDDHVDFEEPRHKYKNKVNNTIIVNVDLCIYLGGEMMKN